MIQDYRYASVEILFQFESNNLQLHSTRNHYFSDLFITSSKKSRITALTNHITRLRGRLDYIIEHVSGRKIEQMDIRLRYILRIAIFETIFDETIPEYAAVNSAVDLTNNLLSRKAARFTNAVLRKMLRLRHSNPEWLNLLSLNNKWYSLPDWILRRWTKRFISADLKKLIIAMNENPPIHIRFNPKRIDIDDVVTGLKNDKIETESLNTIKYFLKVDTGAARILSTDLFQEGLISIQDPAAGAVVELLDPAEGEIILDVCAAPGTKSLLMAEISGNSGKILASDIDPERVKMGQKDIRRHGLKNIEWSVLDARTDILQRAGKILIDAPCTGTGVMARKPDIRWRREKKDIDRFVKLQSDLLHHVANYLEEDGELVYATCSLEPEENWSVVERFLNLNADFMFVPGCSHLPETWINERGCLQTLPHLHGVDGMFAAKIKRI
tara:strand:- start:404 stop:1726 length:1323 start_codon:yes stop_codon:yes gene_type:complete